MKTSDIDLLVDGNAKVVSLDDLLARASGPGRATWQDLPAIPGVYAVLMPRWSTSSFVNNAGRASHAEPTDSNVLHDKRDRILAAGSTDILYIGKASNLRHRVRQLARFGVGRAGNHKGGEWLWQLEGIDEAQVKMWCCQRGRPETLERELLDRFRADHGDWPLANRTR